MENYSKAFHWQTAKELGIRKANILILKLFRYLVTGHDRRKGPLLFPTAGLRLPVFV